MVGVTLNKNRRVTGSRAHLIQGTRESISEKDSGLASLHVCAGTFELPHDKTNKIACVPSEDSDQPGHP